MRRSAIAAIAAIVLAVLLSACHHTHRPNTDPTHPVTPPSDKRITLEELRARQHWVVDHISIPWGYTATRHAANTARGAAPSMDGVRAEYICVSWPLYVALHGDASQQEAARAYWREWLRQENTYDWRKPGSVCSMNHQLTRQGGVFFATLVLGEAESARYGDASKTRRAKQMFLDVLTGGGWYGADGSRITDGPCACTTGAGDFPEAWRSRHYGPRCIDTMLAAAECGDADIERAAQAELDKVVAHMRPGVRADGILDPVIVPEFRYDTGTRCPQYCQDILRQYGLECGPGETPSVIYVWFKRGWPAEFSGMDARCDCAEQYYFQAQYVFGEKWRPMK